MVTYHTLLSRLVVVNKKVCHFRHQFLTQVLLLFQMVPFFFLSMGAWRATNTKLSDCGCWNCFNQSGYGWVSYHAEQNEWYHLKEHWKLSQKLVSKVSHHFVEGHLSEKQTVKGWLGSLQQGRQIWQGSTFKSKNDGTIWICLFYTLADFVAQLGCLEPSLL